MLEQRVCKAQKTPKKTFATKPQSHHPKPDRSGYTICGAGFAALAKMVFEWTAGCRLCKQHYFASKKIMRNDEKIKSIYYGKLHGQFIHFSLLSNKL